MITATYTQFYSGPNANVTFVATNSPLTAATGTSTLSTITDHPAAFGAAATSHKSNSLVGAGNRNLHNTAISTVFASVMTGVVICLLR